MIQDKVKYNFKLFLDELRGSSNEFKMHKERLVDEKLKLKIRDCQIYSAEMFFILKADQFKDEGFIDEYVKGYNAGKSHFENERKEDMSVLYLGDPKRYTEKLRHEYFVDAINYFGGYKYWACCCFPDFCYKDFFYRIGFASGIVAEIELMADKNPTLFYDYENEEKENPYPLIFVGENSDVYDKFIEYTENHILDFYIDYSYLKKRLEKEKLIHNAKDNDFMRTLFENMNLITKKNYEDYLGRYESKLRSLGKSYNIHRENNFNKIFKELLLVQ